MPGWGAGAGAADPGAEEHVGLPDLVGAFGLVLLVRGGGALFQQELSRGETAGAEEAVESGGGQGGVGVGRRKVAQQRGSGAVRVFAFETLDEGGGFRRDGAELTAVLTGLGGEGGESIAAITQGPLQQRIDGDLAASGEGDVEETGGDLLGASCQFTAWQRFQNEGGDEAVAEEGDFLGFVVIHRE